MRCPVGCACSGPGACCAFSLMCTCGWAGNETFSILRTAAAPAQEWLCLVVGGAVGCWAFDKHGWYFVSRPGYQLAAPIMMHQACAVVLPNLRVSAKWQRAGELQRRNCPYFLQARATFPARTLAPGLWVLVPPFALQSWPCGVWWAI